jgi:hypothetical protein
MKGLKGNRRRGTHTTAIALAEKLVNLIRIDAAFQSVQFGEIKTGSRSNGERRIKVSPYVSGLQLQIKEGSAVQRVVVFTKNPEKMAKAIEVACAGLHVIFKNETV